MSNKCKSCGADIIWALSKSSGRRIPLDAKNEPRFVVVVNTGQTYGREPTPTPVIERQNTYQTHFATCPNADEHRKKDA